MDRFNNDEKSPEETISTLEIYISAQKTSRSGTDNNTNERSPGISNATSSSPLKSFETRRYDFDEDLVA